MSNENSLITIAMITMLIAALSLGFTYYTVSNLKSGILTGYATSNQNATVNVSITANVAINFSTNNLDFGSGSLNPGTTYAVLDSSQNSTINGTWATHNFSGGLVLDNIGTVNVSLQIRTTKNASDFLAPTAGVTPAPLYQINISNVDAGSCINATGVALSLWYSTNQTAPGTTVCTNFGFVPTANTIKIDVKLGIPATSLNGSLGDVISATATG